MTGLREIAGGPSRPIRLDPMGIPARERAAMAFAAIAWAVPWRDATELVKAQARAAANGILDAAGFDNPSEGLGR